jgi:hypothetical protein
LIVIVGRGVLSVQDAIKKMTMAPMVPASGRFRGAGGREAEISAGNCVITTRTPPDFHSA